MILLTFFNEKKLQLKYGGGHKAKLLLLKLIHLFAREIFLLKKFEIEETKTTYSTFETDIIKAGLVFLISNFFIAKTSLANNRRSFSSSYLALVDPS